MLEINLNKEEESSNPHWDNFLASVVDAPVGVYSTVVENGLGEKRTFVFVTSSKETHLDLGRMNSVAQYYLAKILEFSFKENKVTELMLKTKKGNTLVVQVSGQGRVKFFLSPVH
ncbi:MAG: hypothetical protein WAV50_02580 [Minisyncoccia bacterium]